MRKTDEEGFHTSWYALSDLALLTCREHVGQDEIVPA